MFSATPLFKSISPEEVSASPSAGFLIAEFNSAMHGGNIAESNSVIKRKHASLFFR
jgi:hypothetical protein